LLFLRGPRESTFAAVDSRDSAHNLEVTVPLKLRQVNHRRSCVDNGRLVGDWGSSLEVVLFVFEVEALLAYVLATCKHGAVEVNLPDLILRVFQIQVSGRALHVVTISLRAKADAGGF